MKVGEPGPRGLAGMLNTILPASLTLRFLEMMRNWGWWQTYHKKRSFAHPKTIFEDDTFLVSYPRSGSTWTRFMLTTLVWQREVTFKTVRQVIPGIHVRSDVELQYAPYPRILKSHSPANPRYPKVIYLVRDGRDVAVSLYYYKQKRGARYSSFTSFLHTFLNGQASSDGTWADHVLSWLEQNKAVPFLLLSYERLLTAPNEELSQAASFLQVEHSTADIERAVKIGEFSRMRAQEMKHYNLTQSNKKFDVRKGVRGDWSNHFSTEDDDLFWLSAGEAMRALGYER